MEIIDICNGYIAAKHLRKFYKKNHIKDHKIKELNLLLFIGELNDNRSATLNRIYPDVSFDIIFSKNMIINEISNNTKIRIWSSRTDDDDYLMFIYLCSLLKDLQSEMSVIFCNEYSKHMDSLKFLDPEVFNLELIFEHEKLLSTEEKIKYATEWEKLEKINSELRVIENNKIICKNYCDYFDRILNILKQERKCKIVQLIVACMIQELIKNAGDMVYLYIIDMLIKQNRIKVLEQGRKHILDIIEVSNNT